MHLLENYQLQGGNSKAAWDQISRYAVLDYFPTTAQPECFIPYVASFFKKIKIKKIQFIVPETYHKDFS